MSDLLRMDYINSLPQPFIATQLGGWRWPVESIEVECGLVRIDVIGKLQVLDIMEFTSFMDADGIEHDVDSFFNEDGDAKGER